MTPGNNSKTKKNIQSQAASVFPEILKTGGIHLGVMSWLALSVNTFSTQGTGNYRRNGHTKIAFQFFRPNCLSVETEDVLLPY